jgi:uncharacterized protein (TIGR00369 family)
MVDPPPPPTDEMLERLNGAFASFVPHNKALGMAFVGYGDGIAEIRLPYRDELVGNPETGALHGGAISSLLDAACGASVFMKTRKPIPIATLDLRIDYLKRTTPQRDVIAKATCYKLSRTVAFVRAIAHHGDENDPIASAAGTFMVGTKGESAMNLKDPA